MPRERGPEPPVPPVPPVPPDYAPGDRISAGVCAVVLLAAGVLLIDIATNGRLLQCFGGSPAAEAERYTREAVT